MTPEDLGKLRDHLRNCGRDAESDTVVEALEPLRKLWLASEKYVELAGGGAMTPIVRGEAVEMLLRMSRELSALDKLEVPRG